MDALDAAEDAELVPIIGELVFEEIKLWRPVMLAMRSLGTRV